MEHRLSPCNNEGIYWCCSNNANAATLLGLGLRRQQCVVEYVWVVDVQSDRRWEFDRQCCLKIYFKTVGVTIKAYDRPRMPVLLKYRKGSCIFVVYRSCKYREDNENSCAFHRSQGRIGRAHLIARLTFASGNTKIENPDSTTADFVQNTGSFCQRYVSGNEWNYVVIISSWTSVTHECMDCARAVFVDANYTGVNRSPHWLTQSRQTTGINLRNAL